MWVLRAILSGWEALSCQSAYAREEAGEGCNPELLLHIPIPKQGKKGALSPSQLAAAYKLPSLPPCPFLWSSCPVLEPMVDTQALLKKWDLSLARWGVRAHDVHGGSRKRGTEVKEKNG